MTMIPLLVARLIQEGAGDEMGDLEYLAIKEFEGKLRTDRGSLSIASTLTALTATAGKDMYIGKAKVVFTNNGTGGTNSLNQVELQLNGSAIEIVTQSITTSVDGFNFEYEFKDMGHKVLAGQVIRLQVTTLGTTVDVVGFIECWEEDTGASPQIPPLEPV